MFLPQVFENLLKRSIRFFDVCGKEQAARYESQATETFFGAAFLKNCRIKNFLFACGSYPFPFLILSFSSYQKAVLYAIAQDGFL